MFIKTVGTEVSEVGLGVDFCAVGGNVQHINVKKQAHCPPWNRPKVWASISDMIRMPAPRTSA
jgi:hypothetical protein